jgi:DNA-binding NarL/FixJ family response regulator
MLLIDGNCGSVEIARDSSATSVERARAHCASGAALRRAGRSVEAREPLRLAVDLAHRCGATALEEQALAELRATGAKPRRRRITGPGSLTRSERRITELAAAGSRNREIADELVVALATVEYHLRNAYRKLGIASRTELRKALGTPGGPRNVAGARTRSIPETGLPPGTRIYDHVSIWLV